MLTLCSRPFRPTPLTLRKVATLCARESGRGTGPHAPTFGCAIQTASCAPSRCARGHFCVAQWLARKGALCWYLFFPCELRHSAQRGTVTSQELRLEALCKWRCCPPCACQPPWRSLRKAEPRNGARSSVPVYPRYRVAVQEAALHGLLRQRLQRHCKATEETAPRLHAVTSFKRQVSFSPAPRPRSPSCCPQPRATWKS